MVKVKDYKVWLSKHPEMELIREETIGVFTLFTVKDGDDKLWVTGIK